MRIQPAFFSQLAGSPHFSHFYFVQNNYLVCICYGPHSVSYTHLDVYKRQVRCPVCGKGRVIDAAADVDPGRLHLYGPEHADKAELFSNCLLYTSFVH